MARYILIDNCSGYIWGDTGDLNGPARDESPIEASRRLDESLNEYGRGYEQVSRRQLASNESGYHVYRADVDGSEAIPLVYDSHDKQTLNDVERLCEYICTIRCWRAD